jgi:hypothetical protein
VAQPGNAAGNLEYGISDLASHHIDFVASGDRDKHVSVPRTGTLQDLRIRSMTNHAEHIKRLVDPAGLLSGYIDNGDISPFHCEMTRDRRANLSGTADNDFHGRLSPFRTGVVSRSIMLKG